MELVHIGEDGAEQRQKERNTCQNFGRISSHSQIQQTRGDGAIDRRNINRSLV
jgi:hypothetical protein